MVARNILAALLAVALGGTPTAAQPNPAAPLTAAQPRPGQKLKDSKGATLGQIEKVIADSDGRPRQVMVSVARVLRILPVDALTLSGDAYVTVLTRGELESLPPAD
jgi:hypothetical protein